MKKLIVKGMASRGNKNMYKTMMIRYKRSFSAVAAINRFTNLLNLLCKDFSRK